MRAQEQNQEARRLWITQARQWDVKRLLFLDECGINTTMHRRFGRAPRGERAVGVVPRNWKHNTSVVGALSLQGVQAVMTLPGALDTAAFEVFVQNILVPTLVPGQILILDNLSVHKSHTVQQMIEAAGCTLIFLPTYSPDLNPIERVPFGRVEPVQESPETRSRTHPRATGCSHLASLVPSHNSAHPKLVSARWLLFCGFNAPPLAACCSVRSKCVLK